MLKNDKNNGKAGDSQPSKLEIIKQALADFKSAEVEYIPSSGSGYAIECAYYRVTVSEEESAFLEDMEGVLKPVCESLGLDLHLDDLGFDLNDYSDTIE